MKEKIKKYIGGILLLVGSFTTTYELFGFKHSYYGSDGGLSGFGGRLSETVVDPAVYYYYSNESLLLLSVGVSLIVLGILIIKKINN